MYIHANFIRLCTEAGKTPTKVAEEAGVSKSLISRWKSGGGLTDRTALKLSNQLGVPVTALTEAGDLSYGFPLHHGSPTKQKKPADQKAGERRGMGNYDRLTPDNQKMIDSLIESLLKSQSGE